MLHVCVINAIVFVLPAHGGHVIQEQGKSCALAPPISHVWKYIIGCDMTNKLVLLL